MSQGPLHISNFHPNDDFSEKFFKDVLGLVDEDCWLVIIIRIEIVHRWDDLLIHDDSCVGPVLHVMQ